MRDLSVLAEQIRSVRSAQKRFLKLWRVEQVVIGHEALDRLAADVAEVASLANELLESEQETLTKTSRNDYTGYEHSSYDHAPRWPIYE